MFLMIRHVMRIPHAIYHMTIWNIGGITSILQPLKKFLILNFELMDILIIIQVLFIKLNQIISIKNQRREITFNVAHCSLNLLRVFNPPMKKFSNKDLTPMF